jgi:hypothetical protein
MSDLLVGIPGVYFVEAVQGESGSMLRSRVSWMGNNMGSSGSASYFLVVK